MPLRRAFVPCLLLSLLTVTPPAQPEAPPAAEQLGPLTVGVRVAPPFVIQEEDGSWSGISIDLWEQVADELGVEHTYRELDLGPLLEATEAGGVDVAVAALTITPDREAVMDFTHPFLTSGLGIAAVSGRGSYFSHVLQIAKSGFLGVVLALAGVILLAGVGVWLFERKRNPEQFGGGVAKGLGAGFWWSAVTMTTVGYGDKAPVTLGGRIVGLIWMFAAIIMISGFTAAIATSLTTFQLQGGIQGPQDLPRVRVATVENSTSVAYLSDRGLSSRTFSTPSEALTAAAAGEAGAVVYDAPILRHLVNRGFQGQLVILPQTFERQDYGFALPQGSGLREPINRALLSIIAEPEWQETLTRYLGE